jgi:hypothetical protein
MVGRQTRQYSKQCTIEKVNVKEGLKLKAKKGKLKTQSFGGIYATSNIEYRNAGINTNNSAGQQKAATRLHP